ncbi:MAG: hypothetical protein HC906_04340 [Bacteroidales bacterium]|nr:hypothetical protein [Bacteroidales bacterium]
MVILYINRANKRAKIVYTSYYENQAIWKEVIRQSLKVLRKAGCCSVSVLGKNQNFINVLKECGFKARKHDYSVFFRDTENLLKNIPLENWHLTFYESDKGYRDIV